MIFHDIEQNTDAWFDIRAGKLTSSNMGKVMANYGKAFGNPAKQLATKIAIERITEKPMDSNGYSNAHMERGHEQEPIARSLYETEYFCDVTNGGFFDGGDVGCSPDGLVDNDGCIEIKSVIHSVHMDNIKRQSIDPAYKWQCIANLHFTGRDWLDFISYCAEFPQGKRLYVCRVHSDQVGSEVAMMNTRIVEFMELVETTKDMILNSRYSVNFK
jgi:hypothetical protein